ncbi:MAG: hypothetical protein DSM106950_30225 [Stigonema ocellatum SAG 48.90 = DSM 106950]|nr:hypothetical protein [Stigonema ocellatum SAG 48.90 = DSM 106950]
MSHIDISKLIYSVRPDFYVVATNIAALVFPATQFQLLSQKISSDHAALIFPASQFHSLSPKIGSDNLAITFKSQKHFSESFRVRFFPKITTLTVSGYYKEGMAHLIYIPANNYNWLNGRGYQIKSPDGIGEKFEFLANKFYPFLEEFFLG